MSNRFFRFKERYSDQGAYIKWFIQAISFYLGVGIMMVCFLLHGEKLDSDSIKNVCLELLKLLNLLNALIIGFILVLGLIGYLLTFLFSFLKFLSLTKWLGAKKFSLTPLQAIVGILLSCHIAYLVLVVFLYQLKK